MTERPTLALVGECESCFGLCCVVSSFTVSRDFALTKPSATPCPHLDAHHGCSIHEQLRPRGFRGCTVYDCFGAGQRISQETFGGRGWRDDPDRARSMFGAFAVMRDLHESLWYLGDALRHLETPGVRAAHDELAAWCTLPADELAGIDTLALWGDVEVLLVEASEAIRTAAGGGQDLRDADLAGADLAGADLAYADVRGADLRDADLSGADLRRTLYLVQAQLSTARGDAATQLPEALRRPAHWA